ncbi:MAG: serine/threonine protein kinase [Pirellulaceae bacterium]
MTRARDFLGSYRLARLIRVGNTTAVWEAIKTGDPTRYALKIVREDLRKDRVEIAALKHELEVGQKLKHKNIIHIFEFNTEGSIPYLVMELFECPNLKLLLRQGVAELAYLVPRIIEQSAEALFYLHEQGWIHRDVKPDNFLVNDDGLVKLIDFAISERYKKGIGALFSFGSKVQGTRSYMSPEQIRGKTLDPRADIYSFGCMLFELVAGKLPFTGTTADELLTKHLSAPIPPLGVFNENTSPEFANLVKKMMQKRKEDRPDTMWDVVKEFRTLRVYKIMPKPPEGKIVLPRETATSVDDLKRGGPKGV